MERECEMEKKLRRSFLMGSSKRAGPSTPPPAWRLGAFSGVVEPKEFLVNSDVSVRKLCADLWETEQFHQRIGPHRRKSPSHSPFHDQQPPSRSSLRKQTAPVDDNRRLVHRNGSSRSSCSNSSLEVMVRKPAFSQTDSSVVKSASYGLGSSTKLLKVLNRIWSLEEQNTANMSLVKALKTELDECRAEIKEVKHREKHSDRRKEEEEVKNVLRSIKKELDGEREGRKKSESMHRKLTRELCEAKHCLNKALKDLEKERKERVVVENLCDEFAKAVKDYEDKVRRIGNKSMVSDDDDDDDKVIVQIAEVWNDQRLQMKQEVKRRSHSRSDSASTHQMVCLKELEKRARRDNKLQLKMNTNQVFNLSTSSEGDKIHPETSPRYVDECLEKSRKILTRNVNATTREDSHRTLKDKLMEARVESRRLRSLKPESSPSHSVQV